MRSVPTHAIPSRRETFEAVVRDPCRARHFHVQEVAREDVEHMVAMATYATSACDSQAWRFVAIQDRELIAAMAAAVIERFDELASHPGLALHEQKRNVARAQALAFTKAPLCLAVLVKLPFSPMEELMQLAGVSQEEHDRLCARPELQSAGAAVQLLTTSAHTMGYAACWSCAPMIAGDRLESLLSIEPPNRLAALVSIGRPSHLPVAGHRRRFNEVLSFGQK